jgi:hypothetical protein
MSRFALFALLSSTSLVGAYWTCEKKSKLHGWNTAFALTHNSKPASQETSPGDIMTWHAHVKDPANGDKKVAEITGAAINARRPRRTGFAIAPRARRIAAASRRRRAVAPSRGVAASGRPRRASDARRSRLTSGRRRKRSATPKATSSPPAYIPATRPRGSRASPEEPALSSAPTDRSSSRRRRSPEPTVPGAWR